MADKYTEEAREIIDTLYKPDPEGRGYQFNDLRKAIASALREKGERLESAIFFLKRAEGGMVPEEWFEEVSDFLSTLKQKGEK